MAKPSRGRDHFKLGGVLLSLLLSIQVALKKNEVGATFLVPYPRRTADGSGGRSLSSYDTRASGLVPQVIRKNFVGVEILCLTRKIVED